MNLSFLWMLRNGVGRLPFCTRCLKEVSSLFVKLFLCPFAFLEMKIYYKLKIS